MSLGNADVSRMCGVPQIHATVRSRPSPKPECTNVPYLPEVEVPAVRLERQTFLLDAREQLVVVILAL